MNRLRGGLHDEGEALMVSCNSTLLGRTTVVFHLSHGGLVRVRDVSTGCGDSLQVWRDGRRVSPPLDPGGFAAGVAAIVK